MKKPSFWPENPYPESVFPMPEERYPEIVPDPGLRTALSGMLGRRFWDVASETIWEAILAAVEDDCLIFAELDTWESLEQGLIEVEPDQTYGAAG